MKNKGQRSRRGRANDMSDQQKQDALVNDQTTADEPVDEVENRIQTPSPDDEGGDDEDGEAEESEGGQPDPPEDSNTVVIGEETDEPTDEQGKELVEAAMARWRAEHPDDDTEPTEEEFDKLVEQVLRDRMTPEERAAMSAEKILAAQRRWRNKNPEKVKGYQKKWREKNPEKVRAAHKKYQQKHPEKVKEWHKASRERARALVAAGKLKMTEDRQRLANESGDQAWLDAKVRSDAQVRSAMEQLEKTTASAGATTAVVEVQQD